MNAVSRTQTHVHAPLQRSQGLRRLSQWGASSSDLFKCHTLLLRSERAQYLLQRLALKCKDETDRARIEHLAKGCLRLGLWAQEKAKGLV